jgi:hypothetical protein
LPPHDLHGAPKHMSLLVFLMSIREFSKRTEYTAIALYLGVVQGIVIYFYPKGKR